MKMRAEEYLEKMTDRVGAYIDRLTKEIDQNYCDPASAFLIPAILMQMTAKVKEEPLTMTEEAMLAYGCNLINKRLEELKEEER